MMKRLLPSIGIFCLALHLAHAQWPAERHPLYDAAAPDKATSHEQATQLMLYQADNTRLTIDKASTGRNWQHAGEQTASRDIRLHAWRGERCSSQLSVQANGPISLLRASCTELRHENGDTIPATVSMIRYTKAHDVLTADIIGNENTCHHMANGPRGIWLQVDVPRKAEPGEYRGEIQVTAPGCVPVRREVILQVNEAKLPAPDEWRIHLDLWQYPLAVARWHHVTPWSDEHFALLRPLMKRLAEAGQKCITCTILDEAWNAQTYDWYPGMVRWIRGKDGVMRYDYSALDAWISFMHDEIGIHGQISCYTMIPWHLSITYYDEASQSSQSIKAIPGTPEYEALWVPFLRDFHRHMDKKGWAEKTCMAIDERPDAYVRAAMALIKEHAPSFRIASAVDQPSELTREVYNISPVITHAGTTLGDLLKTRQAEGRITTFYVCLHPLKPNTFTHSQPAEAEWLGFFAAANHLDGFLRWAYNAWNRNPFECTDFVHWPSGDCFLVYPGNLSSVRFERLRDGIENYEKINILRDLAAESTEAAEIVRNMDEQLTALFTVERSKGNEHAADVEQARRIIDAATMQLLPYF